MAYTPSSHLTLCGVFFNFFGLYSLQLGSFFLFIPLPASPEKPENADLHKDVQFFKDFFLFLSNVFFLKRAARYIRIGFLPCKLPQLNQFNTIYSTNRLRRLRTISGSIFNRKLSPLPLLRHLGGPSLTFRIITVLGARTLA